MHIGAAAMRALPVALPALDKQRRIADFLNDQVARLGAAMASTYEIEHQASERS